MTTDLMEPGCNKSSCTRTESRAEGPDPSPEQEQTSKEKKEPVVERSSSKNWSRCSSMVSLAGPDNTGEEKVRRSPA